MQALAGGAEARGGGGGGGGGAAAGGGGGGGVVGWRGGRLWGGFRFGYCGGVAGRGGAGDAAYQLSGWGCVRGDRYPRQFACARNQVGWWGDGPGGGGGCVRCVGDHAGGQPGRGGAA